MQTIADEIRTVGSVAYWGERREWLIAAATHRDAGAIQESNFRALNAMLENTGSDHDECWAVEEVSHWAVGWVRYLLVAPDCTECRGIAERARESLEDYLVLNEELLTEVELELGELCARCYGYGNECACRRGPRRECPMRGYCRCQRAPR